ncbi:hypothetical protein F5Y10DRAFT_273398 [Nemania abortiva]|nr:hypothetical protein F5Y10DRAFT_273398 [Nemania abortiva]
MANDDFYSLPFNEQVEIFNKLPSMAAPDGIVPNYDHPRARNDVTITVIVVGLAFTVILFIMRMYSRLFIVKKLRLEDYVGIAGFVTYVTLCGILGALVHTGGFLAHQWDVLSGRTIEISKWSHLFVPYPTRNAFFWTCHVLIWANIGLYSSVTVVQHTKCLPYIKNWYSFVPGHCINTKIVDTFVPTFNFFIDLAILIFPQKTIWKLHVPRDRRLAISAIFSSGILERMFRAVAFAGARVSVSIRTLTDPDFLWLGSQSVLFGLAEMTFAFWVFCIPAAPKSLHGSHITHLPKYIWSKVRSTAALVKKPSQDFESNSWPAAEKPTLPQNACEAVGDMGDQVKRQDLQNTQPDSSIPHQHQQKGDLGRRIGNGVLRTMDLMTSVSSVDEDANNSGDLYKRQHPWV